MLDHTRNGEGRCGCYNLLPPWACPAAGRAVPAVSSSARASLPSRGGTASSSRARPSRPSARPAAASAIRAKRDRQRRALRPQRGTNLARGCGASSTGGRTRPDAAARRSQAGDGVIAHPGASSTIVFRPRPRGCSQRSRGAAAARGSTNSKCRLLREPRSASTGRSGCRRPRFRLHLLHGNFGQFFPFTQPALTVVLACTVVNF